MKLLSYTLLSLTMSIVFLLSGCSLRDTVQKLDEAEQRIEQKLDQAEEKFEQKLDDIKDDVKDTVLPTPPSASDSVSITADEAQSIALEHAGFAPDEVLHLRVEFESFESIPHYDVQFYKDGWEYEYEINSKTGEILSFEKDD